METESASNEEENNKKNKRDHIQERLKEMGVSQDSVRPKRSWFSRNVNFLLISIVAILVGAFAIEYQSSKKMDTDSVQVVEQSPAYNQSNSQKGASSYYQPANGMAGMEMHAPGWMPPQYRDQNSASGAVQKNTQQNNAANETYQNNNSDWYGQQGYYDQPQYQQYYGFRYQQPPVQNQQRIQQQVNSQYQEPRNAPGNRQPDFRGQYYNGQYGDNKRPAYNPYYVPMPNPYSMPYPTTGYYNGWYR